MSGRGCGVKLLRVGAVGQERPAALDADGRLVDLSGVATEIDGAFLSGGGVEVARVAVAGGELPVLADPALRTGGYAVSNDLSEREFQLERGGQWDKGKSCETFNPLGPWLVTADEIPDPQDLGLPLGLPDPKPYLRAGDVVEVEIDGLGSQRQTVGQAP